MTIFSYVLAPSTSCLYMVPSAEIHHHGCKRGLRRYLAVFSGILDIEGQPGKVQGTYDIIPRGRMRDMWLVVLTHDSHKPHLSSSILSLARTRVFVLAFMSRAE